MCCVPNAVGKIPVMMLLREGAQTGDTEYMLSNTVPSEASAVKAGMDTVESPYCGKNSPWSSQKIQTIETASSEVVTLLLGLHPVNKKMQVMPPTNKRHTQ